MDVYESDLSLSLFGGDLLAGLSSPLNADADLPNLFQDGYQVDVLKPQATTAELLAECEPSSEGSFLSVEPASDSVLNNGWLDVNRDLLDLLEEFQPDEPLTSDHSVLPLAPAVSHGSSALEILQSMADETEHPQSATPPPAPENASPSTKSHHIAGSSVLRDMLVDNNTGKAMIEEPIVLGNYMNVDVDEKLVLEASLAPILSPVSPEDVECLLSSGPCSPSSAIESQLSLADQNSNALSNDSEYLPDDDDSSMDETWLPSKPSQLKPARSKRQSVRPMPYVTKAKLSKEAKQVERKLRKKQQNRDAALRYRNKKKQEGNTVLSECEQLEKRNHELKDKADQLTREIKYLKDLMADVHRAKMLLKHEKQCQD